MALRRSLRLADGGFMESLGKWARSAAGYRQMGLMTDDLIREEIAGVKEAISRLPQEVQDKRYFRIKRAMHLTNKDTFLPKDQWITEETDERYLQPVLAQVEKELAEAAEYDNRA